MHIALILPRVRVWLNKDGPNFSHLKVANKKGGPKSPPSVITIS
jgi:hypothetical protein